MSKFISGKFKTQRKARKSPERDLQIACVDYLRLQYGDNLFYFHPPNGGNRNVIEAALFKKMGVLRGLCDLLFLDPFYEKFSEDWKEPRAGLVAELKAKGKKVDEAGDQASVMARLERLNYKVVEIDNLISFVEIVDACYGHLKHRKRNF